jgi:hypothetical protein
MKLNRLLVVALAAPALAFAVSPKAAPTPNGRAEVQFLESEKFTDVRSSLDDQGDRNGYLDQLRDHIAKASAEFLPEGQKLQMTFTDIDLAGDFPPGRSANANSVRVMKDIYPPRMAFAYRVTDASGNVVKEGKEELTDPNYMTTMSLTERTDPLRYDKALLSDWFRKNFSRK